MNCTDKEWNHCRVEKMKCRGCYYDDGQVDEYSNWRNNMEDYKLCYIDVDTGKAYFTNDFEEQCGDDWDDKPFECNAEEPHNEISILIKDDLDWRKRKFKRKRVDIVGMYFDCTSFYRFANDFGYFSVNEINKEKKVPWVVFGYDDEVKIYAETTIKDFIHIVEENGGTVYLPKWRGEYENKAFKIKK